MRIYYAHMDRATRTRKTPTNLSVRADLVARAKELGLNISQVVERALEHAVRAAEHTAWLEENREAIEAYNKRVEKHGVFSDEYKRL
jgi:antitoxin CcdA